MIHRDDYRKAAVALGYTPGVGLRAYTVIEYFGREKAVKAALGQEKLYNVGKTTLELISHLLLTDEEKKTVAEGKTAVREHALEERWGESRARNREIYRLTHEGMSFAEAGRKFGISSGRAQQIFWRQYRAIHGHPQGRNRGYCKHCACYAKWEGHSVFHFDHIQRARNGLFIADEP